MKRINLDQMKNMSIDNLIELYRDGYRLEEHIPITSLSNFHTFNFSNILSNIHTLQGPLLDPVVNFGKVTVSTGYDAAAMSIILNTNEGSKLPDPSSGAYNIVWWNSTDYPDPSDDLNKEIVRCTAKTTDTLTVTRAQEGTSASVKNLVGKTYKMILTPTAKMISDISSAVTARVAKTGDTMTGTLNLPTNGLIVGTNQLVVSGGNVGIGTAVVGAKLAINGDLSFFTPADGTTRNIYNTNWWDGLPRGGGAIKIGSSGSNVADKYVRLGRIGNDQDIQTQFASDLTVDYAGNIGIGTTSPDIVGSGGTIRTVTIKSSTAYGNLELGTDLDINGNDLGRIQFVSPAYTSGSKCGAIIQSIYDGTTAGSRGAALIFITKTDGAVEIAERMRISAYGNVGIGTTNPFTKLHVYGAEAVAGTVAKFERGGSEKNFYIRPLGNERVQLDSSSAFTFGTNATDTTTGNEVFRINANGNVGIGTVNPQQKLDVSSGNIQLGDNIATSALFVGYFGHKIGREPSDGSLYIGGGQGYVILQNSVGIGATGVNTNARLAIVGGGIDINTTTAGATDASLHIKTSYGNMDRLTQMHPSVASKPALNLMGSTDAEGSHHWWVWGVDADVWRIHSGTGFSGSSGLSVDAPGNVGIGTTSPSAKLDVSGTDAIKVPNGTTVQRPASPVAGMIRFNTTTLNFEGYNGSDWRPIISLFSISASDNIIHAHDATASTTSVNVIVKMKTMVMGYAANGTFRIKFSLWSSSPTNTGAAGRIYKNGTPIGTLRYAQTILTFSEDFNMGWMPGDTIELWGNPYTNALAIYVSNFRICAVASGGTVTNL